MELRVILRGRGESPTRPYCLPNAAVVADADLRELPTRHNHRLLTRTGEAAGRLGPVVTSPSMPLVSGTVGSTVADGRTAGLASVQAASHTASPQAIHMLRWLILRDAETCQFCCAGRAFRGAVHSDNAHPTRHH